MAKISESNVFKVMSDVKSHTDKYEIDLFSVHILILIYPHLYSFRVTNTELTPVE